MRTIRTKHPIARKEHKCVLCRGIIAIRERYERQTNTNDGTIYNTACHDKCSELEDELNIQNDLNDDECVDSDVFFDAIYDYIDENHRNKETGEIGNGWDLPIQELVSKILEELKS